MSTSPPSDPTRAFYDENAQAFFERTSLDMEDLYRPFLSRLKPGARILDAGCGPGRDLAAFAARGYKAVGMDASLPMVKIARKHSGCTVHHMSFAEIEWHLEFDGVWACASLLHVPEVSMADVLHKLARALRPSGVMYASFKYGEGERQQGDRRFTDYTEQGMNNLLEEVDGLNLVEAWRTADLRKDRACEHWLNLILRKTQVLIGYALGTG